MANDRISYVKFITPRVTAVYPHLNKADDKFGEPVFKVNGRAQADAFAPMVGAIEDMLEKLSKADPVMLALLPEKDRAKFAIAVKAKKAKPADPAYIQETDAEGNELGTTVLKFKKNGSFKDKTGAKQLTKLPLFDSKKNPVTAPIWGGSIVVVAGHYMPWVSAKNEYGVKLAMDAVQVIELKSGGSGGTADSYGFGEEEDGWAQPEATAAAGTDTLAADVDSADDF